MDLEKLAKVVHKAYCEQRVKDGKEPYWTGGDYSKLDEKTKEYDRVTVRAVLEAIGFANNEKLREALEIAKQRFTDPKYNCVWKDAADDIGRVLKNTS